MSQQSGVQPEIRFHRVGPNAIEGVSFLPKVMHFKKESISGTSNNDFFVAPAGTFVQQVVVRADTALDGSGTVTIGTDGDPDGFIDTTGFDASSAGNWATNIGTTTAFGGGTYLHAGDTLRLAVGGTPTVGAISGFLVYYELEAMEDRGFHIDMS